MIKILNHHEKLNFHIFLFCYTLNYNFFSYILYIITHLYVVNFSWNSKILKQFWNILWIFKVLEFHIFESMSVANMFYFLYFFQWFFLLYEYFL
jgi:hypothetical protein